jgi:hypothetical protein
MTGTAGKSGIPVRMKELFIERTAICYDIWKQTLA